MVAQRCHMLLISKQLYHSSSEARLWGLLAITRHFETEYPQNPPQSSGLTFGLVVGSDFSSSWPNFWSNEGPNRVAQNMQIRATFMKEVPYGRSGRNPNF